MPSALHSGAIDLFDEIGIWPADFTQQLAQTSDIMANIFEAPERQASTFSDPEMTMPDADTFLDPAIRSATRQRAVRQQISPSQYVDIFATRTVSETDMVRVRLDEVIFIKSANPGSSGMIEGFAEV
jgi:hypothetical protein